MTLPSLRWLDEIVRAWVGKIENEKLLIEWRVLLTDRLTELENSRRQTFGQLVQGLRQCKRGDTLHLSAPYHLAGELRDKVYFHFYQPRKKKLWYCLTKERTQRSRGQYAFPRIDIERFQPSRTELAVRQRAPKT